MSSKELTTTTTTKSKLWSQETLFEKLLFANLPRDQAAGAVAASGQPQRGQGHVVENSHVGQAEGTPRCAVASPAFANQFVWSLSSIVSSDKQGPSEQLKLSINNL